MPKQPTAYHRPHSVEEALTLLRQPNTVPLAGGTALLATEEGSRFGWWSARLLREGHSLQLHAQSGSTRIFKVTLKP